MNNADAVCRHLGFAIAIRAYCASPSTAGDMDIFIGSIGCDAYDYYGEFVSTIEQCNIKPEASWSCRDKMYAAVECASGSGKR